MFGFDPPVLPVRQVIILKVLVAELVRAHVGPELDLLELIKPSHRALQPVRLLSALRSATPQHSFTH